MGICAAAVTLNNASATQSKTKLVKRCVICLVIRLPPKFQNSKAQKTRDERKLLPAQIGGSLVTASSDGLRACEILLLDYTRTKRGWDKGFELNALSESE